MVGQSADKTDCVHEHDAPAVRKLKGAGGGIEGGEKLILGENPGVRQTIEQRGLARVGVAHNGGGDDAVLFAAAADKLPVR